jgi:hypothetical protein
MLSSRIEPSENAAATHARDARGSCWNSHSCRAEHGQREGGSGAGQESGAGDAALGVGAAASRRRRFSRAVSHLCGKALLSFGLLTLMGGVLEASGAAKNEH